MPSEPLDPRVDDAPTAIRTPEETPTLALGTAENPDGRFTPGTILGGRYRIVSMLGRGGMGEVYRADDLKLGQAVALKFLPQSLVFDPSMQQRLFREARVGREVTHPNVCRLYDIIEIDQHLFLSMEYVDGEDLASLLRRIGRLPPDKALAIAGDLCAGLAAAHEKEVIHRDLKPGNVMIDGRGRARITDFGLAMLGEGDAARGAFAGTPAYMAPEQLTGRPATVQSDLYALGLVLFETFSGRRAIDGATSMNEIAERQKTAAQTSLSSLVPGLDERIDRAVTRCLQLDPDARPRSAQEVLELLPTRDPLALAIAAGETPTPGTVAEAAESGELPRGVAWVSLLLCLTGIAGIVLIGGKTTLYRLTPPRSPEILEARAQEIILQVAPDTSLFDSASWFSLQRQKMNMSELGLHTEKQSWSGPHPLVFNYRSSPQSLIAANPEFRVHASDPPLDVPGMSSVTLDDEGRLLELVVVPPIHERATGNAEPDWPPLFAAAGLDPRQFRPTDPEWSAPVDSDRKMAWRSGDIEVLAAAFHSQQVWFAVMRPGDRLLRMYPPPESAMNRVAMMVNIVMMMTIPIAVFFLARRNLRRGQGDVRGAIVLGSGLALMFFLASICRADHSTSFRDEWTGASYLFVGAFFWGIAASVCYLAAEPLVRRRWPRMMIGWSRLLAGRWKDPMIGKEVLVGMLGGLAVLLVWHLATLVPLWLGLAVKPLHVASTPLGSVRHVAYYLFRSVAEAALRTIGAAALLVLIRGVVRHRMTSFALTALVLIASFLADSTAPFAFRTIYAAFAAMAVLLLLTRFGVLALGVTAYVILLMRTLPLTLDPSVWFFPRSSLVLSLLAALAVFGFLVSLGRQSLFGSSWFEEAEV